jgi:hypothetical protein
MPRAGYEIRVVGSLGPAARAAFADLDIDIEPVSTTLSGYLEQEDLHALLDRMRDLGIELLDLRQLPI